MKTNTTKFINSALAVIFSISFLSAKAQPADSHAVRVSFGVSTGLANRTGFGMVYGADVRAQRDFNRSISGILSIGYSEFQHDRDNVFADYGFVPIKFGAKVFPLQRVYITGELGSAVKQHKAQESEFIWSPGVGYAFDKGLDVGLRYEESRRRGIGSGQFALRIAYGINLTDLMRRD